MRYASIDIPQPVIDAMANGTLAIFAGSGVSMDPPSNYPDFEGLADEAKRVFGFACEVGKAVDLFFGELDRAHPGRVHSWLRERMSRADSRPNDHHETLLKLFGAADRVRIVTTNFDPHLSRAARHTFGPESPVEEFYAPALPTGNRFSGIVYLHGSVMKPSDRLILTDYDFGRAYLSEGWACRFLIDLFRNYTVLFVGYSCKDTVVQYLARGISPEQGKAYSFAASTEDCERWQSLHITPVEYNNDERLSGHSALWSGLDLLARDVWSRSLDHERRVRELLAGSPPPIETGENDYLVSIVRDPQRIDFFVRYANEWQWVEWADREGLLKLTFDIHAERSGQLTAISDWLACRIAAASSDEGIRLFIARNSRISDTLWRALLWRLGSTGDLSQTHVRSLLTLLLVNAQASADDDAFIMYGLVEKITPSTPPEFCLTVLRYLITPRITARVLNYPGLDGIQYEATCNDRSECLQSLWDRRFKNDLNRFALPITAIIADVLSAHSEIWLSCEGEAAAWDELANSRPDIAVTPSHAIPRELHTLVEVLLQCLDWMRDNAEEEGAAFIRIWGASKSMTLRRLAVHELSLYPMTSPTGILEMILSKRWLTDSVIKRELLRLVSKAYSICHESDRNDFLDEAERQFAEVAPEERYDEDDGDREMFRLLSVISQSGCAECGIIFQRLHTLRERHPDWGNYVQPEFTSGSCVDISSMPSPVSVDELISQQPNQIVDYIVEFRDGDSFRGGSKRMNLCGSVAQAVRKKPSWGLELGNLFLQRSDEIPDDLWHALIQGFGDAPLDGDLWVNVLAFLNSSVFPASVLCQTAFFISHHLEAKENQIPLDCFTAVFDLCVRLWECSRTVSERGGIPEGHFHWAGRALNHTGGVVVQCVVSMALRKRNAAPNEWNGLTHEWRDFLETVLAETDICGVYGRVMMAMFVAHFTFLDADWAHQHILPIFDWSREPQDEAPRAWDAHGTAGRTFSDVTHVILPLYANSINRWEGLSDEALNGIVSKYVVMLFWIRCSDDDRKAHAMRVAEGGAKTRAAFAAEVRTALSQVDGDLKQTNWRTWILPYLSARISDIGQPPNGRELKNFLDWASYVPDFPAYVSEIIRNTGRIEEGSHLQLLPFKNSNLLSRHPADVTTYLTWLLEHGRTESWLMHTFEEMAQDLLALPVPPDGLEALLELLCGQGSRKARAMDEELGRKRAALAVTLN